MFLKTLSIENKNGLVREIFFRKGLNLIVDETPDTDDKVSGNNVGKTSVLRLIDYCLGSKQQNIYQDPEFKNKTNTSVENFLKDTNVLVTLTLVDDYDIPSQEVQIQRNFLTRNKKIFTINGEKIPDTKRDLALKNVLFQTRVEKPSFREILSKNIRNEKDKLSNIVQVLHSSTSSDKYEALFLFWLGITTHSHKEKQHLIAKEKREKNFQRRLKKEGELSLTEQQLSLVTTKIAELKKRKQQFRFHQELEEQFEQLNQVKLQREKLSTKFSHLAMRRELIQESKTDLESEKSHIDIARIELLYKKATKLLPNLQKSFQETLDFHNSLLSEKIQYLTKELPLINRSIQILGQEFEQLRKKERELSEEIGISQENNDYEEILSQLHQLFEQKGNLEERKELWQRSNDLLAKIHQQLAVINESISKKDPLIQERISIFNKYFSKISDQLYGEEYLLSSKKNDKGYSLIVTSLEGNPSPGKKKGQIAAFDFAYIKFAQEVGIHSPHFILHDQLESVHGNQLSTILVDLANSINCQFVLPIVKDKIPAGLRVEKNIILTLSQTDKLFRV